MTFSACKAHVLNRGVPPDDFLAGLVKFGKAAPDEIFAPNAVKDDIYTRIKPQLGPWTGLLHRKAAMLEALRVLSGFESSWNWLEGRDTSAGPETPAQMETGAWQVSFDSLGFGEDLKACVARAHPAAVHDPGDFQAEMKYNHQLACEYIARLLRHTVRANGPVVRNEINPWLNLESVTEFESMLS